ncbi:MAG: hypothetical protein IPQ09_27165 [Myxococcales bacterium]|nr:hypothetical protein [Myxococcales bacterium]
MDCEKFDSLIIDELYEELDELTSAAMKRHAAGCESCAAKLGGLRATRAVARLETPELPAGLEERILASSRDAQVVVPIARGRFSRAVSLAGTWAMRPQTAMAALFLLMIGSSAVLLRSRQPRESAALTVTQEGAPSPQSAAAEEREFDDKGAAAAHGATPTGAVALATNERAKKSASDEPEAPPPAAFANRNEGKRERGDLQEPQAQRGLGGAAGGGAPLPAAAPTAAAGPAAESRDDGDGYAAGLAAYRAQRYAEATRRLDEAAARGNATAALWAARSVRDSSGCGAALARFDAAAARGGPAGHDATFEGARCHEAVGDVDGARARYRSLLGVPAYAARAQAALDSGTELASRRAAPAKAAAAPPSGGAREPSKNAAPKPAAPPAVDRASSF